MTRPSKGSGNRAIPHPHQSETAKAFCGKISNYRRFIPNCTRIASPLYKLLNKDTKFEWTETQENAFQHLKSKLTRQPILQYPDFSSELGQQCTLDGSTPKNDVWCCWLFKLELKYPNLTWEHNLLKLCAELEQYKSCLQDGGARTSIECSHRNW